MLNSLLNLRSLLPLLLIVLWVGRFPAQTIEVYTFPERDSLSAVLDSVQTGFLADVRDNKHKQALVSISLGSLLPENGLFVFINEYKGFGSDLYEVSTELVNTYYNREILLYNFYDRGYVFISLKDAQNRNGLLQIRIPFDNLRNLYDKYKRKRIK
jgi:hypothetical protein